MHTHSRFLPTLMHKALSRIRRAPLQCLLAGLALLQAPALEAHMDPREALLQAPVVIEIDIERGDLTVIAEYANGLSAPEVPPLLLRANRDEVLTGGEVSRTLEKRRKRDSVTTELLDEYLDEDVTVVKWHYALPGLPEIIEIIPQTGEKTAIQARHAGLAVNQLNFLQQPEMLLLDWVDPWHTRFRNPGIRRAYQLPVMLYLAEEDDALRFEAVLRVVDVLGIEDIKQTWNGHTRDDISHQVIELVKQHAHLSVNGQPVPFDLVSSNFVDRTVKGITKLPDSTDIQALTGTLALVFTAKKPDGPGERQLDWDFYNDSVEEVPLSLKGPNHLSESKTLSQADSTFAWSYAGRVVAPRPALPQAQRQPYTELPVSWALLVLASLLALISLIRRKKRWQGFAIASATVLALGLYLLVSHASYRVADEPEPEYALNEEQSNLVGEQKLEDLFTMLQQHKDDEALLALLTPEALAQVNVSLRPLFAYNSSFATPKRLRRFTLRERVYPVPATSTRIQMQAVMDIAIGVSHWGHVHSKSMSLPFSITVQSVDGTWKISDLVISQPDASGPS